MIWIRCKNGQRSVIMLFNADKCKRLHDGHSYHSVNHSIGGVEIKNVKT